MEAYFLFRSSVRPEAPREVVAVCDEQDEDIGSLSGSESSPSTSGSSSELDDDASSSSCSGSDRFEMSDLMTELPIKRGLSRFFDGRSQSFASLAAVGSLEDLAKPPRKRLKPSRSCGGGLDAHRGRLLSPRRHCTKAAAAAAGAKKAVLRSGALAVLAAAAAPRRPPLAAAPRPEGVAGNVLVVS
ncbi:hypothetical protein BAE44_0014805 [Dichanthelium oligosanthes]|uniref:Uncharacterized protein n=1 Tax=Dichanthelium oligosanthes TaxID=888268 RepID=A0A1E5VGK1_9POAL|nr:hypothetical protein BAE44_0014805 [Dichanthelium oligosanthes]